MILQISLDGNDIKLTLKRGRRIMCETAWVGEYTLSEQLLVRIGALLKENKIDKKEIEKITTKISKTSGVTSARIVQTVAKAWTSAQKHAIMGV